MATPGLTTRRRHQPAFDSINQSRPTRLSQKAGDHYGDNRLASSNRRGSRGRAVYPGSAPLVPPELDGSIRLRALIAADPLPVAQAAGRVSIASLRHGALQARNIRLGHGGNQHVTSARGRPEKT